MLWSEWRQVALTRTWVWHIPSPRTGRDLSLEHVSSQTQDKSFSITRGKEIIPTSRKMMLVWVPVLAAVYKLFVLIGCWPCSFDNWLLNILKLFCIPLCLVNLYLLNHYSTFYGPYDDKTQIFTLAYSVEEEFLHHLKSLKWVKIFIIRSVIQRYSVTVFVVNRDNVEWTEEQEASAKKKVLENSQPLPTDKQGFDGFFNKNAYNAM